MNRRHVVCVAAAFLCAFSCAFGAISLVALPAWADETSDELQAKLDEANAQLESLYATAGDISEKVNEAQVQLDETTAQIDQTEQDITTKQGELETAQDTLSERLSSSYKTGGSSILSIILGASSFDDFLNRIYYANKVAESDAAAIQEVKDLQSELDQKKSDLETQQAAQQSAADELTEQQNALTAQISEVDSYVSSLDEQVQQKLAEEKAAAEEAARKAAEEEAARLAEEQAAAQAAQEATEKTEDDTTSTEGGTTTNSANTSGANTGSTNTGSSTNNSSSSTETTATGSRADVVQKAYAIMASGAYYSYGASGPDAYDCSGLVQACYAAAGVYVPHSSGSLASYCNISVSEAQPGDILWRSGHVAIYIGNGRTIEAFNPGHSPNIGFGTTSGFSAAISIL